MTIWKFELKTTGVQTISMPAGAQILTVQEQNGNPCIWAIVDPEKPKSDRSFEVFGTGHPLPIYWYCNPRRYIGTYQLQGGALVFHLFEFEP